ncbi:O-antigen/teichoic acid export membrane protein [Chryseobacterium ginsenosidimutans]|uniref:lipopolysaccharide biosynthesis protein n=1 Tax=Chryseobacterium ginsenosidimutans TaxID=687846 RepID=UPI002167B497|nr:lipopolysaccharide biosynthesis protein [Chryseobacterium ginsenosidimutans]MCS3868281.1 O-antigen/teichoic acid export membrane protein [Chryseobacterium ginsenosidimutans]
MNNFLKAFLSFGLATSIEKLLGFILLPIYTKYFNATEYGIIDMIGTILQVTCIFGLLQLETSLQRYYYEYNSLKKKLLVSTVYYWISACSIVIGLLIFFISPFLSQWLFGSVEYSLLIKTIAIQLPLTNISMLGLVLLRFEKENVKFLIVIVTKVVTTLLFVYIFIIYLKLGLKGVFIAQVSAIFCSTALVTFYVRKQFVYKLSNIMSRKNLQYALPQFPARVGSMVLGQANRFFMLGYLSLAAIGIYSVSMKLASSIQLVNTAFIMAWAPFMHAQFKKDNNKKLFADVFPIVVGVTFLFVCLISLFSLELVKLLATKEFYSAYKYVGGLSLFFSLYIIKETVDIGPKIKEKTKYLSFTFILSVIVNIISLFVLIQLLELKGVVLAMVITNLFLVILSWFISNKLYPIPFSIVKFVLMLVPTLIVVILIMYIEISLFIRVLIGIGICSFFGINLIFAYKKTKEITE